MAEGFKMTLVLPAWNLLAAQLRSFLGLGSHKQSKVTEAAKAAAKAIFGPSGVAGTFSSSRLVLERLQKLRNVCTGPIATVKRGVAGQTSS